MLLFPGAMINAPHGKDRIVAFITTIRDNMTSVDYWGYKKFLTAAHG